MVVNTVGDQVINMGIHLTRPEIGVLMLKLKGRAIFKELTGTSAFKTSGAKIFSLMKIVRHAPGLHHWMKVANVSVEDVARKVLSHG